MCSRLFLSFALHKAALCTTHGARSKGWSSGTAVGRLLAILWDWATACTLLSVSSCLWWAQTAFSPAPVKFLHTPYSPHSACVRMCDVSPREQGATQPAFSFTSLLGPLWVAGCVLLPSVPPPCPFFCPLQSSFETMHVHKTIGMAMGCP